jgi:hypothetical protein
MAIKGKTKARSRRTVTPGPKPAYVVRKKRFLARRGVRITLLVVLVVGAGAGITYGLVNERNQQREREADAQLRDTVTSYRDEVTPALTAPGVGLADPSGRFVIAPDAFAVLSDLSDGKEPAKDASSTLDDTGKAIADARKALAAIDTVELFRDKGLDPTVVSTAQSSQTQMVNGLTLYEEIVATIDMAVAADGSEREHLTDVAVNLTPTAKKIFDDGYADFQIVQQTAGIFVPPQSAGGVPGGVPGGLPGTTGGIPGTTGGIPGGTGGVPAAP